MLVLQISSVAWERDGRIRATPDRRPLPRGIGGPDLLIDSNSAYLSVQEDCPPRLGLVESSVIFSNNTACCASYSVRVSVKEKQTASVARNRWMPTTCLAPNTMRGAHIATDAMRWTTLRTLGSKRQMPVSSHSWAPRQQKSHSTPLKRISLPISTTEDALTGH